METDKYWALALMAIVGFIMLGAVKGCEVTQASEDLQHGQNVAAQIQISKEIVECVKVGKSPAECAASTTIK